MYTVVYETYIILCLSCACRASSLKMYEIGAVKLTAIPTAVAQYAPEDVHQLPKILASCDAVIKDSTSAQVTLIVEAKHRFPFVESKGVFTFMRRRRLPMKDMSVEYFSQCQLQMLVLDVMRCDLISYSLSGSTIFHLRRNDRWCGLALQLLRDLHTKHISTGEPPTTAFYRGSVRQLHDGLVQQTVKSMQELLRQRVTEARSVINPRATDRFLDDKPEADPRKQASRMYPSDKQVQFDFAIHATSTYTI